MSERLKRLSICLREQLGGTMVSEVMALGELTVIFNADHMLQAMMTAARSS